jgi:hypothetical protein
MITFNSKNDLKIDPSKYMEQYETTFSSLINQKSKDRTDKIDRIMHEIKDNGIFQVDGTDEFKEKFDSNIRLLLEVKPGRLLLKELVKIVTIFHNFVPIQIKVGKRGFHHSQGGIDINFNETDENKYNALFGSKQLVRSRPSALILAHELIHELHYQEEELKDCVRAYHNPTFFRNMSIDVVKNRDFFLNLAIYPRLELDTITLEGFEISLRFDNLSNPEEQHTILGINISRFIKKNILSKVDVLSENAFLCAFNLLPRCDHQPASNTNIEGYTMQDQEHLPMYYHWLLKQLDDRNEKVNRMRI